MVCVNTASLFVRQVPQWCPQNSKLNEMLANIVFNISRWSIVS
jgi:hypothetical protein